MADFDFDELDKAVTGALGSTPTAPSTAADIPDTPSGRDTSAPGVTEEPRTTVPERSTSAPAARRSSGRFMDMVHPASDMRSSRPVAPRPVETPATPSSPVVAENPSLASEPVTADSTSLDDNQNDLAADMQKPLESPFLPDAKVEKRPLGGTGLSSSDFSALSNGADSSIDALLLEAPDEPQLAASTMPDPIDFAPQHEAAEVTVPADTPAETPIVQQSVEQPVQSGPSSIPHQYEEVPSSSPESGAIYDTEAYHQPFAQPAKKKSGVLVIVWILVLIAVGAGAGAAFYLYVLPLL